MAHVHEFVPPANDDEQQCDSDCRQNWHKCRTCGLSRAEAEKAGRGELIYVASPYTDPNKVTQEFRFLQAVIATGWLMNKYQDASFYSPISHTHPIATYCKLPGDWNYWKQFDETVLSRCQAIWVLCIPGWSKSTGVKNEVAIAVTLGLEIKYVIPLANGEYLVEDMPRGE